MNLDNEKKKFPKGGEMVMKMFRSICGEQLMGRIHHILVLRST
uniref:Uncharacterized protein n=1 Tax=Panagrolaimus sp. ES5 TaxID=591445 RepID=A0AC34FSV6_9BILA